MANEYAAELRPEDFVAGSLGAPNGGSDDPFGVVTCGFGRALSFGPKVTSSAYALFRVPNAALLATGFTLSLTVADDPNNPAPGKVAVFGVTYGPVTSSTTTYDENATTGAFVSTTEDTGSITLPATSGTLLVASIAAVVGHMNSLAAGGWCVVRIRRLGANASETHSGRVLLLGASVRNT